MKFDLITNDRIVDAMQAYAGYVTYRDKCDGHGHSWANHTPKAAGFVVSIWEKARDADRLIKHAGLAGITANTWLWSRAVRSHIKAGHLDGFNTPLIEQMLADDEGAL